MPNLGLNGKDFWLNDFKLIAGLRRWASVDRRGSPAVDSNGHRLLWSKFTRLRVGLVFFGLFRGEARG